MSKRSSASKLAEPLDDLVFFVDRSLGRQHVVNALRGAGATVHTHDEHFAQDTTDTSWLETAGEKNWIVLTKDKRIQHRQLERMALAAAGVRAFVITAAGLKGTEIASLLAGHLKRIANIAHSEPAPFIARVGRSQVWVRYKRRSLLSRAR